MDHRTALATFRTLALRAGTTARRTAGHTTTVVVREVRTRVADRRSTRRGTPPGPPPGAAAPDPEPTPSRRGPSPSDVSRAVARNAAGLARTSPPAERRPATRRSGPGAKLPARAGQGIVGV